MRCVEKSVFGAFADLNGRVAGAVDEEGVLCFYLLKDTVIGPNLS